MFEDAGTKVRGALARATMTAMITPTAMIANPTGASQIWLFPITIACPHWEWA